MNIEELRQILVSRFEHHTAKASQLWLSREKINYIKEAKDAFANCETIAQIDAAAYEMRPGYLQKEALKIINDYVTVYITAAEAASAAQGKYL